MGHSDGEVPNSWDSDQYDHSHAFVYKFGEALIELLDPESGERILDLGCGTGHLTAEIAAAGADVVGLDQSSEMLDEARSSYPSIHFVQADARDFSFDVSFDAIFSNATLHWIQEQDSVLKSVCSVLQPDGRFVVEFGAQGNVQALIEAVQAEIAERGFESNVKWYFPSIAEYATTLEQHGFEVQYAMVFDRPTELDGGLVSWVNMFGDHLLAEVPDSERDAVIAGVESRLRPILFNDEKWVADYRRIRLKAVKKPK